MKTPVINFILCFCVIVFYSCNNNNEETPSLTTTNISQNPIYNFEEWDDITSNEKLISINKDFAEKNPSAKKLIALHEQMTNGAYLFNTQNYLGAVEAFNSSISNYEEGIGDELAFMGLLMLTEAYIQLEDAKSLALPMTRLEIMSESITDRQLLLKYNMIMGMANKVIHQNDKALEFYYNAFSLLEDDDNKDVIFSLNNSTGLVLHELRKFEEALYYYNLALQTGIPDEENLKLHYVYNNMSNSYASLKDFEKSEEYLLKAIKINERTNNNYSLIRNYYNLGRLMNDQKKFASALDFFNRSYELSATLNFPPGLGYSLYGLGTAKYHLNQVKEAEAFLRDAERILRELDEKAILYYTLETLILIERKKGNYQAALELYDEYFSLEKLYHENVATQRSDELSVKHNVDLVRLQNQVLQERNNAFEASAKQQKTFLTVSIILLLILCMLFVIALNSKRKTQKLLIETENQKIKIENQKEKLSQLMLERDALVKTIIHDLRNPISAIQGFSSLLKDEHSEEERKLFIQMLNSSSNQLDVLISSLSNAYLDSADQSKLKFHKCDIQPLLTEIIQGFMYESKFKNIKIETDLEAFEASANKNAIFTVLGNLLSNALKFSPKGSIVFIQSRKHENQWELLIRDQGPGFSIADREKMFGMFTPLSAIPTNNEISTGLGLFSVKKTLQFIGGDIQLNTQYVEGAEFICTFPLDLAK
ncbi:MAG: tetratricopeptide repeat-containing sensor histidine kinase [Crocinitomicaceae bacterium]|nr:tetratricopeptide repeat-containing sensor histidine kinase [Crocinitomicaceae bacterium]